MRRCWLWLGLVLLLNGCKSLLDDEAKPAPQAITLKSPKGGQYLLTPTEEKNDWTPSTHDDASGDGSNFIGKGRELVKTSPANAPLEVYKNLFTLIESLPPDEAMLSHVPKIENEREAPRVFEENGQVQVKAWIFAINREQDNSFRLMLGSYPTRGGSSFISAVVSGLPASGPNRDLLARARRQFLQFFGKQQPTTEFYSLIQPAVPVLITASLHYCVDHPPTVIGLKNIEPGTNWELRPVTDLVFEP